MPYDFLGGDLQIDQGQEDFISCYIAFYEASAEMEDFSQAIEGLSRHFPADAGQLLTRTLDAYEERYEKPILDLGQSVLYALINWSPKIATAQLEKALRTDDDGPYERKAKQKLVEKVFSEEGDKERVGLSGLAAISRAYLASKQADDMER